MLNRFPMISGVVGFAGLSGLSCGSATFLPLQRQKAGLNRLSAYRSHGLARRPF